MALIVAVGSDEKNIPCEMTGVLVIDVGLGAIAVAADIGADVLVDTDAVEWANASDGFIGDGPGYGMPTVGSAVGDDEEPGGAVMLVEAPDA